MFRFQINKDFFLLELRIQIREKNIALNFAK